MFYHMSKHLDRGMFTSLVNRLVQKISIKSVGYPHYFSLRLSIVLLERGTAVPKPA